MQTSNELSIQSFERAGIIKRLESIGVKEQDALREISFALQAVQQNPGLSECDPQSILKAVVNAGNIRLTLNPAAKEAYLVARYNRVTNSKEASLEPSYIGLIQLAIRAGGILSMNAQPVYENDEFRLNIADNTTPVYHSPCLVSSKRGGLMGVYAIATLTNGARQVEWMDIEEVNAIRERSDSWKAYNEGKVKTCTWLTDYVEMARKSVVKRIIKYLPKSQGPMQQALQDAVQSDNEDYGAEMWQMMEIEELSKVLDDKPLRLLESEIRAGVTRERANEIIHQLRPLQLPDHPRYGVGHKPAMSARKAIENVD